MKAWVSMDWLVAITIFMVFVSFSFVHYTTLMRQKAVPTVDTTEFVADEITDYLFIDFYELPVQYNSSIPETKVLYFDYNWPNGEANSTRVLLSGSPQPCTITGDRLYWQSNVTLGIHDFIVSYSNLGVNNWCNASFPLDTPAQLFPMSEQHSRLISQYKWNQMNTTPYGTFRNSLGINREFRVEMNVSGTVYTYGLSPPLATDVYGMTRFGRIDETNEPTDIHILVW